MQATLSESLQQQSVVLSTQPLALDPSSQQHPQADRPVHPQQLTQKHSMTFDKRKGVMYANDNLNRKKKMQNLRFSAIIKGAS